MFSTEYSSSSTAMTCPFAPRALHPLRHYYRAVRPSPAHRYFQPRGWSRLCFFPWHRRPGSHVPYQSQIELRAAYMPDAAWAVSVHPPSSSRKMGQPPVLTSSNRISTLPQRFAGARLPQPCLSKSCSDFSATFTTIAFDDSSLRWLEISTWLTTSKDLPSSLVQLRSAVWTGVTRDTRTICDSKYPPAEPGALVLEPLEAAYPCRFSSAALPR